MGRPRKLVAKSGSVAPLGADAPPPDEPRAAPAVGVESILARVADNTRIEFWKDSPEREAPGKGVYRPFDLLSVQTYHPTYRLLAEGAPPSSAGPLESKEVAESGCSRDRSGEISGG